VQINMKITESTQKARTIKDEAETS
jgi:hypothetical protein